MICSSEKRLFTSNLLLLGIDSKSVCYSNMEGRRVVLHLVDLVKLDSSEPPVELRCAIAAFNVKSLVVRKGH